MAWIETRRGRFWSAQPCPLAAWLPFYVNLEWFPRTEELYRDLLFWLLKMGMFRFLKDKIMLDRLVWQRESRGTVGARGSVIRKSSKMWRTKDITQLCCNIHSRASESWLKIDGAERSPNGSTLSKSMKQSEPNPWIAEMALSIVMYCREK